MEQYSGQIGDKTNSGATKWKKLRRGLTNRWQDCHFDWSNSKTEIRVGHTDKNDKPPKTNTVNLENNPPCCIFGVLSAFCDKLFTKISLEAGTFHTQLPKMSVST